MAVERQERKEDRKKMKAILEWIESERAEKEARQEKERKVARVEREEKTPESRRQRKSVSPAGRLAKPCAPPHFDGRISFKTYLVQLRPYLRLVTGNREDLFVDHAVGCLKGDALEHYASTFGDREEVPSWTEFVNCLNRFCTVRKETELDLRLKLSAAWLEPNATLKTIVDHAIKVKAKAKELDDASAISLVLINCEAELISRLRFNSALQSDFSMFDSFCDHALALFESGDPICKRIKHKPAMARQSITHLHSPEHRASYTSCDTPASPPINEYKDVPVLSAEEKQRRIKNGLCFLCGKRGHTGVDCPERESVYGLSQPRRFTPRKPTPAPGVSRSPSPAARR